MPVRPDRNTHHRRIAGPPEPQPAGEWSDAELVCGALRGQPELFGRIVERYHADCLRFAWRFLGRREDAEDAVQETFLAAYRFLHRYRERDRFRAWLWRILVNHTRTVARRRRRWTSRVVADELAVADAPAQPSVREGEPSDALQLALETLDLDSRELILLKYFEGLDYADLAALTGLSVPALKMRVKRAADRIRPRLEALFHERA